MNRRRYLRRAGAVWRVLVHQHATDGPASDIAHRVQSDRVRGRDNSEWSKTTVLPRTEFDELVVGRFLHVEAMDTGRWWVNAGGVTLWIEADRDGNPISVTVYGPGDYADAVAGCKYEVSWSGQ